MPRKISKDTLKKSDYKGIYIYESPNGTTEYLATFRHDKIFYQRRNLSSIPNSNINTAFQASEFLKKVKIALSDGKDPWQGLNPKGDTIKTIVLEEIANKKPKKKNGNNSHYKRSLELFFLNYIDPIIGQFLYSEGIILKNFSFLNS